MKFMLTHHHEKQKLLKMLFSQTKQAEKALKDPKFMELFD